MHIHFSSFIFWLKIKHASTTFHFLLYAVSFSDSFPCTFDFKLFFKNFFTLFVIVYELYWICIEFVFIMYLYSFTTRHFLIQTLGESKLNSTKKLKRFFFSSSIYVVPTVFIKGNYCFWTQKADLKMLCRSPKI